MKSLALIGILLATYAGGVALGHAQDPGYQHPKPVELALPSPEVAKVASVGFQNALADLYFLRALQYYGNPWNTRAHYVYLYPLVRLVAALDPSWELPLRWGAIAIEQNLGKETWLNTAASTRLLRLGVKRFPMDWRYRLYLAYNLSTFDFQYEKAAKVLEGAIGLPGAPEYIAALAARLHATAGDMGAAETLAEAVLHSTRDPHLRKAMKRRIVDIETEAILRRLDKAIRAYHQKNGTWPKTIGDVVTDGELATLPGEPRGGGWYIDPTSHTSRSTRMTGRFQVFRVPK